MQGDIRIINELRLRMVEELTAATQYEAHQATLAVWEYPRLVDYLAERIADERKHFDLLSERIRFLGGVVEIGLNTVTIGSDIRSMHENDLALEMDGHAKYNATIQLCIEAGDAGTRGIIETILIDEEDHIRDLEAQLTQIDQMTEENYLSAKI